MNFCTIITANYFPFALTLFDALKAQSEDISLHVLISNDSSFDISSYPNLKVYTRTQLCGGGIGKDISDKYLDSHHDAFRWSMKPVFMSFLLNEYDKIIYVDNDVHFYSDFRFLFKKLDDYSILLSPHFRSSNPKIDYANFISNYNDGLFNGGFIGASKSGLSALGWWAETCHFSCEVDRSKGLFVDQGHLTLIPIFFENIYILKNRGCNVANWNQIESKRELVNGRVLINGTTPIVFIHFTKSTIRGILYENDDLLRSYLDIYNDRLLANGWENSLIHIPPKDKPNSLNVSKRVRRKLNLWLSKRLRKSY